MADPRRAALASLFIIERSGNLYALRVRDQATGGWALRPDERIECPVSMLEARMIALRDGLVDAAIAAIDAAAPADPLRTFADAAQRAAVDKAVDLAEKSHEQARIAVEAATALAAERDALRAEVAALKAELAARSPEGRKAAQLALFAAAEADPAGEAQRSAASGAAVDAIVGAAPDSPPPEAKPRRTVTCSKCQRLGHNARGCHPEAT